MAISYEKLITDVEALQMIAELCQPPNEGPEELGLDAIADVAPGGHFFETAHTLARYREAFYPPLVHDYANFGTWQEAGGNDATARAAQKWQAILANPADPQGDAASRADLKAFMETRINQGGADPVS